MMMYVVHTVRVDDAAAAAGSDCTTHCPECFGNATCRDGVSGSGRCVCPPGYFGQLCDQTDGDEGGAGWLLPVLAASGALLLLCCLCAVIFFRQQKKNEAALAAKDGVIAQKEAAIEPLLLKPHPLDLAEYAISADNLRLQKVINAGASGVVYLATLGNEATVVSVKEIKETQANPDEISTLKTEATNLAMLGHHPCVTRLFGFCKKTLRSEGYERQLRDTLQEAGVDPCQVHHYIVMEHCRAGSMTQVTADDAEVECERQPANPLESCPACCQVSVQSGWLSGDRRLQDSG